MLQPRTARMYIGSIDQASQSFLDRWVSSQRI